MTQRGSPAPAYAYALNNPLRYVDPDGKGPVDRVLGWYAWWELRRLPWTRDGWTVVNGELVPTLEGLNPFNDGRSTRAITLASSICATGALKPVLRYEQQHIVQRQTFDLLPGPFSEAYFPLHIVAQAYSYWETGDYALANWLEIGPYSVPPRPWP